jgi:hypothetical protein
MISGTRVANIWKKAISCGKKAIARSVKAIAA